MKYKFIGKKDGDALSGHMYDNFTKGNTYEITFGKVNNRNPLFKEVYRADENFLTIDDSGKIIWVSGNSFRKYFVKL